MQTLKCALGAGAAGTLLALAGAASAQTLSEAIAAGKPILEVRPRYEFVDQANLAKNAEAFTVRTRLGWETGEWNDLKAVIEFDDVSQLGPERYNTTVNGKTAYPVIADPSVTELNQLYLAWRPAKAFGAVVGRQRINFDDQRFVGAVAWRQDDQTFDAARADLVAFGKLKVAAAYLDRVNRVFGDELDWKSDSWLLNASYDGPAAFKPTLFYYALDFKNSRPNSSQTLGARVAGAAAAGAVKFAYAASYAWQSDYGSNPADFSLNYWMGEAAATFGIATLKANYEELEGNGVQGFATPLATLHAFQGWADVFLTTPADGVKDANISLILKPPVELEYLSKVQFVATYHDFEAQRGGADLGSEIDLMAQAAITKRLSALVKYADYDGVTGFPSRSKFWFGFEFKL